MPPPAGQSPGLSESVIQQILHNASIDHRGGNLAKAEEGFRRVLKEQPAWAAVWNALGTVLLDSGKTADAKEAFGEAISGDPPHPPAFYNLGRLHQLEGEYRQAADCYEKLIEIDPGFSHGWNNLGATYRNLGRTGEAISCYRRAVTLAPMMSEGWNNLGVALDELKKVEEAVACYRKALELKPGYLSARYNLGVALQKMENIPEAVSCYRQVLGKDPTHHPSRYMLQTLGLLEAPAAAPVEYVRNLFDEYANSFEKILVDTLKYETPRLLFELTRPLLKSDMKILDLGCGTGLGAELYRPFASRFTGVDASPRMLEKASEKDSYDRLILMDILEEWDFRERFDLIYSSDVFVYIGDIGPVLRSAFRHLTAGGTLAFSTEMLCREEKDYELTRTGRFKHSRQYIETVSEQQGFHVLAIEEAVLRKEGGKQVKGLLSVLGR